MKKIILSGLLFLGVLSAQAQAQQQGTTEYEFQPHWYVQIQPLGLQHTLGELSFGKLNNFNLQAAVGYNFNKVLGARLSVNGWSSKAGIEVDRTDIHNSVFKSEWRWNYIAPSVELTANLSNALLGYNPTRLFNLSAFIGVGANIAWGNDDAKSSADALDTYLNSNRYLTPNQNLEYLWSGTKTRFTGRAGLMGDFRINDRFSVGLEVNANTLSDKYNSKKAENWDWYFNCLAGVKVNLGKTYATRIIPPVEPEIRYVDKIVEKIVEVPAKPATDAVAKAAPLRKDIFFKINSWKIRDTEVQKVAEIANYLNENRDAKVVMTGYADKGTGNARINARLAAQRSQAVKDMLVKQYNIAESRISYDSKGDTEQPFAENDKNRVTVCIAE